jgi:hypothetical protein
MDCYECAKAGTKTTAVAICRSCSAGLCLTHLREAAATVGPGGLNVVCRHDTWRDRP